ncbi:MAG: hypothetical protein LBQ43_01420 [Holosporales bacterium]|jgi:hypothetical protein|nr:hypothetical protein [Holosporales bacterium]
MKMNFGGKQLWVVLCVLARAEGTETNILNSADLLADTIADYSEAYGLSSNQLFSLQGILFVGDSWVVWVNNKEISDASKHSIRIGTKTVSILQVTPYAVTVKCGEDEPVTVGVGRSYDIKAHEFADF